MTKTLDEFQAERIQANERILSGENRVIKRFFRLDGETYEDGALPAKTKELLESLFSAKEKRSQPWWWDDDENQQDSYMPAGRLFGQFRFFWDFEKRFFGRLFGGK